ncbi:pre-mRNA cleavage complex 2 protein Pcf11 isoform X2 [Thalassophryne amazonica]|uniref:pre-mRNA cleavage complex 2 protein Pcf11 isoform X2 n=1 Tax=Thalassophryne amazonica TaxID=390379 RepID=UPI0014723729|nr:pre-mRNA cleavage complex 2 protein Pcf11 isoform X2 [Thalassophryne amazonica]
MESGAARADACREYQSSLEDLTFNSKPHINMLTILAEENLHFAKDIVAIIEAQISKAPPAEKLPVLYLVDSIVKNVGGEYLEVFAKNLITSFICVFEKVDENTRKSLFKLRSTWDDVFPLKKLYALDIRVQSLDPAWPVRPLPPPVNAIHVNPKFLKQSEEVNVQQPAVTQPATPPVPALPAMGQAGLTQEQLIRQQLLAKQKQLLELQQKKIELELEQTKAQLAGGFVLSSSTLTPVSTTSGSTSTRKPVTQTPPAVRPRIPPQTDIRPRILPQTDIRTSVRDPRLNRSATPAPPQPKEQPAVRKDCLSAVSPIRMPEKRVPDKFTRPDKARTQKKMLEEKPKAKSLSPMMKNKQTKGAHLEAEKQKSEDPTKKDPRLRKRQHHKIGDAKTDEPKEQKRCIDKSDKEDAVQGAELQRTNKGKPVNGLVPKYNREESIDRIEYKSGGNARTHVRRRTRSRSRSRSPTSSPKRKDRRSPKNRAGGSSASPSPFHKSSKAKRARTEEPQHGPPLREDRSKKNQSENRRAKRQPEDRHSDSRDSHSPRSYDGIKETKEPAHRWRSGWEENKHLKLSDDFHMKPGPLRHKQYNTQTRPTTPRMPKHRLSVDANLQIPEVLNSASKRDLLRRASKRLESGEISQEDFLNMAHQLKHFFQYQEEKQHQAESWDGPGSQHFLNKKQPLLATPPSAQPHPLEGMNEAELSYYEHKSKLRKTQVNRRPAAEDWEGEEKPEDGESEKGEKSRGRGAAYAQSETFSRTPRERQGETRSTESEDPLLGHTPMVEEYNHGKEFPPLKSLQGLHFRRRADPRESSDREWNSPLTERQHYNAAEEQKSGYDAPRRYGQPADSKHPNPRRQEGPSLPAATVHRSCSSPVSLDAPPRHSPVPRFERERLSPLHQKDSADMSPVPRFESPNSEHSDDGPLNLEAPPTHSLPPKSILKQASVGPQSSVRQHENSPGQTPPHEGGHPASRYDGPGHMGTSRTHPPGWYEGGGLGPYEDASCYDKPHQQGPGPGLFDGGVPSLPSMPDRFKGLHAAHGPIRGGDGIVRFEGPPLPQNSGRFEGPIVQQPPVMFDGQGPRPGQFDGPMVRFDGPVLFENNLAPALGAGLMGFQQQQRPLHFDGPPNQIAPMRFDGSGPIRYEGPVQSGPRYDAPNVPLQGGPPRYDCPPSQQVPPRFAPQPSMQPPIRQMAPPIYDTPIPPQQNFPMAPQRFTEPLNPGFSAGQMPFPAQPNVQPGGNFSLQPAPPFTQPAQFYNPAVSMQQPVTMMTTLSGPFLPPNPGPFPQQMPPVVPPEHHFGQLDVNDLFSKLISTGIIKPTQPDATQPADSESPVAAAPAAPAMEEEEEEEQEVEEEDDVPDLTSFITEEMKTRYESVITKLYSGNQCCLCSMRFTAAQTDLYADHLDWHFRQNHAGKVTSKKITHRRWYYCLADWIEFEEIADLEERAKSQFFEKENEEEVQKNQAAAKEKQFQSVQATKDCVGESCEICQEAFETYWVEEEEDWFLKNAIRVDDKLFHPACFEDYQNTSSYLDVTPSPNKLLTDHPLSDFIKSEDEEEEEVAPCVEVKQEAPPEGGNTCAVKKEEEPDICKEDGVTAPPAV